MSLLALQPDIIYGAVTSRRLGRSLGINLLPCGYKLCSFDCMYCQYGATRVKALFPYEALLPSMTEVLAAIQTVLESSLEFDTLTFSGNGEPTLHPRFPEIVAATRQLRDELRPKVRLALLSNSSTAHLPYIQETLSNFDLPVMKLDAGDVKIMDQLNRPAPDVQFELIIQGLKNMPGIILQSVLVDGQVSNISTQAFEGWLSRVEEIHPRLVQLYSIEREVAEPGIKLVEPVELQRLAALAEKQTGIPVKAYWRG